MHGCCGDMLGAPIRWLPHRRQHGLRGTKCIKTHSMHVSGVPGHEDQSTGSKRQISPDETDATCLLAGQHRPESYGWTRRPQSAMDPGCSVDKPQTTSPCTLTAALSHPSCRPVFWCLPLLAAQFFFAPCWLVFCQDACPTTADTQRVSVAGRIPRAARAARLDGLPHQAAAIEFSSSFCAVRKRLGGGR
jgi:hypothetical protein